MDDVIIIGGGGAGCSAGIYAVRSGLKTRVIAPSFGGQLMLTDSIENYPGFQKETGFGIASKIENHLRSYKEVNITEELVSSIKPAENGFIVKTDKGNEFETKTVIVATGKKPRKLSIKTAEQFEHKGIYYCAICDGPLFKGKPMAIIGGGFSAVEEALYLSNLTDKVYVINRGKELGGEEITRKKVLELAKTGKIEIINEAEITEVLGENMVSGLKYKNLNSNEEKELQVNAIFVNIGQLTEVDFVEVEKNKSGEIVIDEHNMSSVEGIFSAGDASNISVKQLVVSCAEGAKSALHAAEFIRRK